MAATWHHDAVIYQIDLALFQDSDGDGWGDLRGATRRLEHVRELGADTVWLLPFYPSPGRDWGYDVTDHLTVASRYGDLGDFAAFLERAVDLDLRVMVDLVAQHTSIEHPWFEAARNDRHSPYRDYYVWADQPEETGVEPVFPTEEDSVWKWDERAGQYYRHTFYQHEPDLEMGNPQVREEMFRIMAFWLQLGVSGFRVDAAPYMVERAKAADPRDDGLWLLEEMRELALAHHPDAVLMGEVDVDAQLYDDYLGEDSRLNMVLDFWLNNHLFLALAREDAEPLYRAIHERPSPPGDGRYAMFLRNHDELDLERLSDAEREEVLTRFAPEEEMRAYGRGIRRRLAPMLDGDPARIAMAQALLLSQPGPPVLLYGDEIGMGENLHRPQRHAVRAPMQWDRAGGFSDGEPAVPLISGRFGSARVNVADQVVRPDSLLNRVRRLVAARRSAPEIGRGTARLFDPGCRSVLAQEHELDGRSIVTLVNLADEKVRCLLPGAYADLVDAHADTDYPPPEGDPATVVLGPHGYRWLRRR